jgi:mono/diheme cytochrome c family protein
MKAFPFHRPTYRALLLPAALLVLATPLTTLAETGINEAPTAPAADAGPPAAVTIFLTPAQERFLARFSPEARARLLTLPPAILARMGAESKPSGRPRHKFEERFTARQVMQQLLADYQSIGSALAMDNGPQAAENVRRLIDHPSPVGHVYPYVPLDRITAANFQALPAMYDAVFGNAERLARAAEAGDLGHAAQLYGDILEGCLACHRIFRGVPGISANLLPEAAMKAGTQ